MTTAMRRGQWLRGQAEQINQATADWKHDHDEAMWVRNLEDVLPFAHVVVDRTAKLQDDLFQDLCDNAIRQVDEAGELFEAILKLSADALNQCNEAVVAAEAKGFCVDGSDMLQNDLGRLRQIQDIYNRRWPKTDFDAINADLENDEPGMDIEDMIREIQDKV